ncbi:SCP-like protein [Ancylostoma caninum]|uniref:SCP-like protein n=1 Tax=Ancylostoma caninum TaxID=29170 RepID=A0A368FCE8_ANCCA|nr:SCP-like protein [Ancylostoma caninum]
MAKSVQRDWDCILEKHAQEAVNKCTENPTISQDLSIVYNKTTLTTCNPTPLFKQQVNNWWDVVKTAGLSDNAAFKPGLESFAVLANGLSTRIGCAQKNCNGDLHMACVVYGKAASTSGQAIYEVGQGCSSDQECTTYAGSKCMREKKFCAAGYPKNGTVVPPTVGTTPTTSTSTEQTSPTTSTTKKSTTTAAQSKYCEKQPEMNTDPARTVLLDQHNKLRHVFLLCFFPRFLHFRFPNLAYSRKAAIAKGEVTMGNGEKARKCPLMMKLKYDCALEAAAYATAKQCLSAETTTFNENWFKIAVATATNKKLAAEKMVWGTNNQIGCGVFRCNNNKDWHVVCRYGPGVGKPGDRIYFPGGVPCRQCSGKCEDNALCL